MKIRCAAISACFAVTTACNSAPKPSAAGSDTNVAAAPVGIANDSTAAVRQAPAADACPHDGKWALCSVERRLRQAGFVVRKIDSVATKRAGFSMKPTVYSLGQSRLEVFLYEDSATMKKEVAKLDTLVVGPTGAASQWGEVPPVLIKSANLGAVILSVNPRQIERVMLALTAGPPQPGSPR